jgi:hypothetical protein
VVCSVCGSDSRINRKSEVFPQLFIDISTCKSCDKIKNEAQKKDPVQPVDKESRRYILTRNLFNETIGKRIFKRFTSNANKPIHEDGQFTRDWFFYMVDLYGIERVTEILNDIEGWFACNTDKFKECPNFRKTF